MQEEQLRSSEALVADFQKTLQQRDSETPGTKVSCKVTLYSLSVNTVISLEYSSFLLFQKQSGHLATGVLSSIPPAVKPRKVQYEALFITV